MLVRTVLLILLVFLGREISTTTRLMRPESRLLISDVDAVVENKETVTESQDKELSILENNTEQTKNSETTTRPVEYLANTEDVININMLDKPESKMGNWEHGSDRVRFIDLHKDSTEEEDEPLEDEEDDLDNDPLNAKAINDEMSLRLSSIQDDAVRMPDKINTLLRAIIVLEFSVREINTIFGKNKALQCKRRKKLYHIVDSQCYKHSTRGPCAEDELFFAVRGELYGECKINMCQDPQLPILYNDECVNIRTSCPAGMQLYYNKYGESVCGCIEGLLYNSQLNQCFNEYSVGSCPATRTWRKRPSQRKRLLRTPGYCKQTRCTGGQVEWFNGNCYRVQDVEKTSQCYDELALQDDTQEIICQLIYSERGILNGPVTNCRRGRVWSTYRQACVQLFG